MSTEPLSAATTAATPTGPDTTGNGAAAPRRTRAAAIAGGAVAAAVVWLLAVPLADADLLVAMPGGDVEELALPMVLGAAVLQPLVGWGILALLERAAPRARTIWLVLVAVVLVVSGINAAVAAENTATAVWLNVLHLAVAAVVVPVLARTSPRR